MNSRIAIGLCCCLAALLPNFANAQVLGNPVSLDSVTVSPTGIISPADDISLEVLLVSGSCCIVDTEPTTSERTGSNFVVNIFAQSGLAAIPDQRLDFIPLGTLDPGDYSYEVNLTTPSFLPGTPPQQITGSFVVIPEPSTALLVITGCFGYCATFRRSR